MDVSCGSVAERNKYQKLGCRMDEIKVYANHVVLRLQGFGFQMFCMDNGWMRPASSSLHPQDLNNVSQILELWVQILAPLLKVV